MTLAEVEDYRLAKGKLVPFGVSLLSAVEEWIAGRGKTSCIITKTVAEVAEEFLTSKQDYPVDAIGGRLAGGVEWVKHHSFQCNPLLRGQAAENGGLGYIHLQRQDFASCAEMPMLNGLMLRHLSLP
jgi:hypothetical protein